MVENIIIKIVSVKFEEKNHKKHELITNDTKFYDIGFDSLDIMECIIEAEGELNTVVENKRIKNIVTVGDLYNLFKKEEDKTYFKVDEP